MAVNTEQELLSVEVVAACFEGHEKPRWGEIVTAAPPSPANTKVEWYTRGRDVGWTSREFAESRKSRLCRVQHESNEKFREMLHSPSSFRYFSPQGEAAVVNSLPDCVLLSASTCIADWYQIVSGTSLETSVSNFVIYYFCVIMMKYELTELSPTTNQT